MTPTLPASVRKSPLLASLGDFDFTMLMDVVRRRTVDRGFALFHEGEKGDTMVIVAEGMLEVRVRTSPGVEKAIAQLGPGEVVGEMSCIDPAPRSATVVARETTTVLELDPGLLQMLKEQAPSTVVSLFRGIIRLVTTRLRETDALIAREMGSPETAIPATSHTAHTAPRGPRPKLYKDAVDPSRVPDIGWLPVHDFEMLVSVAPPMVYESGMFLCEEGAPGASCFLIIEGQVGIFKKMADGRRRLATLGPGAFVGQMALVDRIVRSADVEAIDRVVALEVGRDVFERLLGSASSLGIRFQERVAAAGIRQLRMADQRLSTVLATQRQVRAPARSPEPAPRSVPARGVEPVRGAAPARGAPPGAVGVGDFFRTALKEWGVSLNELDRMEVVRPDGIVTSAEAKARLRK